MPKIFRLIISEVDFRLVKLQQLHAAACILLDDNDTHHETRKEWAIGPLRGDEQKRLAVMTIRTLSNKAEAHLVSRARQGAHIILGNQEGIVVQPAEKLEETTWETLATPQAQPPRSWVIDCLSPTALSSHRKYTPLLDPSSIIGSLSRRWESLHGRVGDSEFGLPRLTEEELSHVWVSAIAGRTVTEVIPHFSATATDEKVFPGFVGRLMLKCDHPIVAAAVDCYLRFARYAGIGALTTHGMGTIQLISREGTH